MTNPSTTSTRLWTRYSFFLFLLAAGFIFCGRASATEINLQSALRDVKNSVSNLTNIKDNDDLAENDKEKKKIIAAKNALEKVLELGLLEIEAFKIRLDELEIENLVASDYTFDAADIHDTLSRLLDYYSAYYNDTLKRLHLIESYNEARLLAKNIKGWREDIYTPGIQKIIGLDLVLRNKAIIKTANARFEKILSDLRKLKNSKLLSLDEVEEFLGAATANLRAAEALDVEATKILLKLLKKTTLNPEDKEKDDSEQIISNYKRISNIVDQSIIKIKEAYKNFIDLNSAVKKLLEL